MQKSEAEITSTHIIDTRTGKTLYAPLQNTFGYQCTKDHHHANFNIRTQKDVDKQLPIKTYWWKLGDPTEKAAPVNTTNAAKNSFYIYDSRYSDVSFSGEGDFYFSSCKMKKNLIL